MTVHTRCRPHGIACRRPHGVLIEDLSIYARGCVSDTYTMTVWKKRRFTLAVVLMVSPAVVLMVF